MRRAVACVLETLESRTLMSAGAVSVAVASGVMTVTGSANDDAILIKDTGVGTFDITGVNGTTVTYSSVTHVSGDPAHIAAVTGDVVLAFGQSGNDTITADGAIKLVDATGGHANFTFTGGSGTTSLFKGLSATGMVAFMDSPVNVAEEQQVAFDATAASGTYTLSVNGNTTSALNWNDTTATIQSALQLLPGCGDVLVSGTTPDTGGALVLDWSAADGNVPQVTADTTLLLDGSAVSVPTTIGTGQDGSYAGAVATGMLAFNDAGAVAATGTVTFNSQLVAGDRLTLNDGAGNIKVFQAVASGATGTQFNIGGTAALTMANFAAAVHATTGGSFKIDSTYTSGTSCTLTNTVVGTAGNVPIVVSSFSHTRITATGMTGTNVTSGNTVTLNDGIHTPTVFTFGTGAGKVAIGLTAASTAANLATAINTALHLNITAVANPNGTVDLTADTNGSNYSVSTNDPNITRTQFSGGAAATSVNVGDTVVLNDGVKAPVTFTAVAGTPAALQFKIGGDAITTMFNFVAAVNAAEAAGTIGITAADNLDGTCTLTADATGVIGNQALSCTGANVATDPAMVGGTGGSIECNNFTVTTGNGTNYVGLGAGFAGKSVVLGNVSVTTGAGDDTVAILGATIIGNVSVALGTSTTLDSLSITDDGTVATRISGTLTVTQGAGNSSVTLANASTLGSQLEIGGAVSINVGENAGVPAAVTTINNTYMDSTLAYTGGAGTDTLNITGNSTISNASQINLGAGTNILSVTGGVNMGINNATPGLASLTYTGGAGSDTIGIAAAGTSEVQTLTPSAAAGKGTYTLRYNGNDTAAMQYNATTAQIQAALRGLAGCQNVVVSGSDMTSTSGLIFTFSKTDGPMSLISLTNASTLKTAGDVLISGPVVENTAGVATTRVALYGAVTINPGDGANSLSIDDATFVGALNYAPGTGATGAGTDDVTLGSTGYIQSGAISLSLGAGANSLTMNNATLIGALSYTGLAGTDTINLGQVGTFASYAGITLALGDGVNQVNADGRALNLTYTGGIGPDTLTMGAKAGSGGFKLDGNLAFNTPTSSTTSTLNYDGYLTNLVYTGGSGADNINLGMNATNHNFLATSNVTINAGNGANTVQATYAVVRGTWSYGTAAGVTAGTSGTGVDTIITGVSAGNATVVGLTVGKQTAIYTGAAADVIKFNNSNFNTLSSTATTSAGVVIDTGTGNDTVQFDKHAGGSPSTTFYRGLQLSLGAAIGTDVDVLDDTVLTNYLGGTAGWKVTLVGSRNLNALVNGSTTGTLLGLKYFGPTYG